MSKVMAALICVSFLTLACSDEPPSRPSKRDADTTKYTMTCTHGLASPNNTMRRCENDETICYTYGEGLVCKFKTP